VVVVDLGRSCGRRFPQIMNKTNEAIAATTIGAGSVAWSWIDQAHHVMQILVTMAGLAWWVRLWLSNPKLKPPAADKVRCEPAVVLFAILVVLLTAGCAYNRPTMRTETRGTNGTVTLSETSARTFALWPATSTVERQKLSNGKTQSIGTDGIDQQGGGTNLVEALRSIDSILGKLRP
jgi:hypothetical protein